MNDERNIAVIFASRPVSAGMRRNVPKGAFVIAADAGWRQAEALGLPVDLAIGDFDSAPAPVRAREVLRLPAEKDDTDTQAAARQALERGFRQVVLLGALGGRGDHSLANLQTMLFLAKAGVQVAAYADTLEVHCIGKNQALCLPAEGRQVFSVFAAGGKALGVTLQGVRYPLDGATLTPDMPLGVSNEFMEESADISCTEGFLYVMVPMGEGL